MCCLHARSLGLQMPVLAPLTVPGCTAVGINGVKRKPGRPGGDGKYDTEGGGLIYLKQLKCEAKAPLSCEVGGLTAAKK